MLTIATIGPQGSLAWKAAQKYADDAVLRTHSSSKKVISSFVNHDVDCAILPVYNTREGENKQYFRIFDHLKAGYWVDNVIVYSDLSLGMHQPDADLDSIHLLVGRREVLGQCAEFIDQHLPDVDQMVVSDVEQVMADISSGQRSGVGFIAPVEMLSEHGFHILEREVAPHNRTRFAVFAHDLPKPTGYDATTFVTVPLDDRVGLLVDILQEFSQRGINILDMRSENDIKTQKLQIYIEAEGHISTEMMSSALQHIENKVIQQPGAIQVLGSFPRIDMRTKHIKSFGFIGTGAMSKWFADRLESEGYKVFMSGRSTSLRPEEMIRYVDVVIICVPISVTTETIAKYGPMIAGNKALILLAGESEKTVNTALETTSETVEVMLVHNLWGPQAATMKDKNAVVVRTPRSGLYCSEFEAFMYKHGADIYHDSSTQHDLLMGVGQKLPTAISVALAMTLQENEITSEDIASHSTLTSLYPILAMARVHSQNPRTYAEIMSTSGAGNKIVIDFLKNLQTIMELADAASIGPLSELINKNAQHLSDSFLRARMEQAKAVDTVLGKMI
ncbi:prephenate dehydratase domain-containing protein [Desulfogranum marinum]|uniref:prephenate dehydratase domain-containing protein n=1 Tax=Desulfogranum marinum TaxID=453220 RepID=UPI00196465DC|nr:prephenate dehydratase domain-containing protein [Desulfogranum marinum]MBM9513858.1 prephenate dehydrogenase/arogenate dehydrogenase family protein [Desulfogranum marinum]